MKTWYEKCYGEPPPVKTKKIEVNPVTKILADEVKKEKKEAWEKAKSDYLKYIRDAWI